MKKLRFKPHAPYPLCTWPRYLYHILLCVDYLLSDSKNKVYTAVTENYKICAGIGSSRIILYYFKTDVFATICLKRLRYYGLQNKRILYSIIWYLRRNVSSESILDDNNRLRKYDGKNNGVGGFRATRIIFIFQRSNSARYIGIYTMYLITVSLYTGRIIHVRRKWISICPASSSEYPGAAV